VLTQLCILLRHMRICPPFQWDVHRQMFVLAAATDARRNAVSVPCSRVPAFGDANMCRSAGLVSFFPLVNKSLLRDVVNQMWLGNGNASDADGTGNRHNSIAAGLTGIGNKSPSVSSSFGVKRREQGGRQVPVSSRTQIKRAKKPRDPRPRQRDWGRGHKLN
jgi:hypothetical protein